MSLEADQALARPQGWLRTSAVEFRRSRAGHDLSTCRRMLRAFCARWLIPTTAVLAGAAAIPLTAPAQMPGQPVLQNAFTNPGWAFGVNYGDSDEALGFGGAVGWGIASGKLGGSVGGGIWDPEFGDNVFAWGGRVMWSPLRFLQEKVGVGAFAGIGGARQDTIDIVQAPAGVAVGYRTAIGDTRAVSVYAAPFLSLSRLNFGGGAAETTTLFRASVGIDAAVLPKVGVTLGYEFGATAKEGEFGPGGGIFGIGVSYVMR